MSRSDSNLALAPAQFSLSKATSGPCSGLRLAGTGKGKQFVGNGPALALSSAPPSSVSFTTGGSPVACRKLLRGARGAGRVSHSAFASLSLASVTLSKDAGAPTEKKKKSIDQVVEEAGKKALRGGLPGMAAMAVQVRHSKGAHQRPWVGSRAPGGVQPAVAGPDAAQLPCSSRSSRSSAARGSACPWPQPPHGGPPAPFKFCLPCPLNWASPASHLPPAPHKTGAGADVDAHHHQLPVPLWRHAGGVPQDPVLAGRHPPLLPGASARAHPGGRVCLAGACSGVTWVCLLLGWWLGVAYRAAGMGLGWVHGRRCAWLWHPLPLQPGRGARPHPGGF